MAKGKPVQLLSETKDKFTLNIDGLKSILEDERIKNKHVIVISIAGEMRRGKSFMLNFLLRYLEAPDKENWLGDQETPITGFSWRNGQDCDTIGILLWSEPFLIKTKSGEEYAVLLMDTQGTFDKRSSSKKSTIIFSLSTLVSSMQIFNVSTLIQEDKLHLLALFTNYGKMALDNSSNNGKPFQHLQFLVRDWSTPYENPFGMQGGHDYIKKLLRADEGEFDTEVIEVRKHIEECFDRIDCCLLPIPGSKVMSSKVFDGKLGDIKPIFVDTLKEYVPKVLSPEYMIPKMVNGEKITSFELLEFFKSYFNVFNSDVVPTALNIFQASAEAHHMSCVVKCKHFYVREMEKIVNSNTKYIREPKLQKEHQRIAVDTIAKFRNMKKVGGESYEEKFITQLENDVEECYQDFFKKNALKNTLDREMWPLILLAIWFVLMHMVNYILLLFGFEMVGKWVSLLIYVIVLIMIVWVGAYFTKNEQLRHPIDDVMSSSWDNMLKPASIYCRNQLARSLVQNTVRS